MRWKTLRDALTKPPQLDDLRNHSPEQLAEVHRLLTTDAPSRPDPKRSGFFEIQGDSHVFYICKYPSGEKIALIAVWERNQASRDADAEKPDEGDQIVCR